MNAPRVPKLDIGQWITIGTVVLSAVATMSVMNWRIGAVENRLVVLDERLWQHMTAPPEGAAQKRAAVALCLPCPADASGYPLRTIAFRVTP